MDCLEHDALGSDLVLGGRLTAETGTLANHAVLEVSYLDDALPVGSIVLRQLRDLRLEKVTVDQRRPRRNEDLITGTSEQRDMCVADWDAPAAR